jgi:hypothetical protein
VKKTRIGRKEDSSYPRPSEKGSASTASESEDSMASPIREISKSPSTSQLEEHSVQDTSIKDILLEIKSGITSNSLELRKLTERMDKLEKRAEGLERILQQEVKGIKEEQKHLSKKVKDLEDTVKWQDQEMENLKKKNLQEVKGLEKKYEKLVGELMNLELHQRKKNLIFYGVEEQQQENSEDVLKKFLKADMKLNAMQVDGMAFSTVHRLPPSTSQGRRDQTSKAPRGLIASFVYMEERDLVLRNSGTLKGTRKLVVQDLPIAMKVERAQKAAKAKELRKNGGKYRVRVVGTRVMLQEHSERDNIWREI